MTASASRPTRRQDLSALSSRWPGDGAYRRHGHRPGDQQTTRGADARQRRVHGVRLAGIRSSGSSYQFTTSRSRFHGEPTVVPRNRRRSQRLRDAHRRLHRGQPSNVAFMREVVAELDDVALIAVPNAEVGIEMVRERLPDIVIMDINLPGMSGYDATRRLGEWPETRDIPVVALSAAAMTGDRARQLLRGFYRYLTKPIKVAELLDNARRDPQPAARVSLSEIERPSCRSNPSSSSPVAGRAGTICRACGEATGPHWARARKSRSLRASEVPFAQLRFSEGCQARSRIRTSARLGNPPDALAAFRSPAFMLWPPSGLVTCAASPANQTCPTPKRRTRRRSK